LLIWLGQERYPSEALYNQQALVRLRGAIDIDRFRAAYDRVAASADVLSLQIEGGSNSHAQTFGAVVPSPLRVTDLSSLPAADRAVEMQRIVSQRAREHLWLKGPHYRCDLLLLGDDALWVWTRYHRRPELRRALSALLAGLRGRG
jgi:hypothetical protein